MVMSGADVDALDRVGVRLEAMSDDLRRKADRLRSELHAAPWRGRSADAFREQFDREHYESLRGAAGFLNDAYETMRRNADEQRSASDIGAASWWHDLEVFLGRLSHEIDGAIEQFWRAILSPTWPSWPVLGIPSPIPPWLVGLVVGPMIGAGLAVLAEGVASVVGFGGSAPQVGVGGTFVDQVRSGRPGPQDLTLARLAGENPPDGWTQLSDDEIRAAGLDPGMFNQSSGMTAHLYQSSDGSVVLQFHGSDVGLNTNAASDWGNNISQYAGAGSDQYRQAIALAKAVKNVYGDHLVLTGHSLGGGLASVASVATGTPAVTFNAAAVNDNTLSQLNLNASDARLNAGGLIRAYHLDGEVLSNVQGPGALFGGPKVLGRTFVIGNPSWWKPLMGPVLAPVMDISDHLMPAVINAMEKDQRFS